MRKGKKGRKTKTLPAASLRPIALDLHILGLPNASSADTTDALTRIISFQRPVQAQEDEDVDVVAQYQLAEELNAAVEPEQHRAARTLRMCALQLEHNRPQAAARTAKEGASRSLYLSTNVRFKLLSYFPQGPGMTTSAAEVKAVAPMDSIPQVTPNDVEVLLVELKSIIKAHDSYGMNHQDLLKCIDLNYPVAEGEPPLDVLRGLTTLCNRLITGDIPEQMRPFFTEFRGIALPKPGSTPEQPQVRPIAIGCTFTTLASKLRMRQPTIKKKLVEILGPLEFGVGMKGGAETFVHTANLLREADGTLAFVSVDYSNAFGTVPVQDVLDVLTLVFPELAPLGHLLMSGKRELVFSDLLGGELRVQASEGVLQGNPLSGAIFSLYLHHVLSPLALEFPDVWHGGFYDDRLVAGTPERVSQWFSRMLELLPDLMTVQKRKTMLLAGPQCDLVAAKKAADDMGVQFVTDGIKLCGGFLGSDLYVTQQVDAKLVQVRTSLNRLELAALNGDNTIQSGMRVVRQCIPPQLTHMFRCTHPRLTSIYAAMLDQMLASTVLRLCRLAPADLLGPLGELRRDLVFLPVNDGGFGFAQSQVVATTGFIGSLALVGDNVHAAFPQPMLDALPGAIKRFIGDAPARLEQLVPVNADGKPTIELPTADTILTNASSPKLQSSLTKAVLKGRLASVLQRTKSLAETGDPAATELHMALRSTVGNSVAGAWLLAKPNGMTKLSNTQFSTACQIRVAGAVTLTPMEPNACCTLCNQPAGLPTANHALRCRRMGKGTRHSFITGACMGAISQCKDAKRRDIIAVSEPHMNNLPYPCKKQEQPTSWRKGERVPKRADIALHCNGSVYVLDVTCGHPKLEEAVTDPLCKGSGATAGYEQKVTFYSEHYDFDGNNKRFLWPIALDSYGHVEKRSMQHLKDMVKMMATSAPIQYSHKIRLLYSILSTAVCKGNQYMVSRYLQQGFPVKQLAPNGAYLPEVEF